VPATLAAQQPDVQLAPAAPSRRHQVQLIVQPAAMRAAQRPDLSTGIKKCWKALSRRSTRNIRLGAGDEITLDFPGRPELSGKNTVGPDGLITCWSRVRFRLPILPAKKPPKPFTDALSKYYTDPTSR
jgi:hypothetical protein